MYKIEKFIERLQQDMGTRERIAHHEYIYPRPSRDESVPPFVPPLVVDALCKEGIRTLYSHQLEAISAIEEGNNVIVTTPTASGKSLIYNLSVIQHVIRDPTSRALYIFPTKALSQDQLRALRKFISQMGDKAEIRAEIYDGDTSSYRRSRIRNKVPHIIITNPDMLHLGILAYHHSWSQLFSNLKFVVLDELHTYRGIFGVHVAQVMRRLRRICAYYGSQPQFVASSATMSNAGEFSKKITGLDFNVIRDSGSPENGKHFIFWDPLDNSSYTEATYLLATCLRHGLKTIVFTRARRITELIHRWVSKEVPHLADKISSYRAGYLPEERREIEQKLFKGELLGVISTSALELGIDVGGLDCCILVGYPGSVISTWQRSGRVGRGEDPALIIMIPLTDALDQYFLNNPSDFFRRSCEMVVIDENNEPILSDHLWCAAAEIPLSLSDEVFYNGRMRKSLIEAEQCGKVLRSGTKELWFSSRKYPQSRISIRSTGESYTIVAVPGGQVVGAIGAERAFHECHPGAIYLHKGVEYEVVSLNLEQKTIQVREVVSDYYTQVTSVEKVEVRGIHCEKRLSEAVVRLGELRVTEQVVSYEKRRLNSQMLISEHDLSLPPDTFDTVGIWIEFSSHLAVSFTAENLDLAGGLHALEHSSIALFPLFVLCDRWDVGGVSAIFHLETKGPVIFIYDSYPGGVGLANKAFQVIDKLLLASLSLLEECQCEVGCPSCVQSPKCGSGNKPLDKRAAIFLLHMLSEKSGLNITNTEISRLEQAKPVGCSPEEKVDTVPVWSERAEQEKSPEPFVLQKENVVFFDLETQKSALEVGGWQNKHLMRLAIAVTYDMKEDSYKVYREEEVNLLIKDLMSVGLVVGFNIKRFDWEVLRGYTDTDLGSVPALDIMEEVSRVLGHRLSLGHLAEVTLGIPKIGHGLESIRWFREGKVDQVIKYCQHDVYLTKMLYDYGRENGYLLFRHRSRGIVRVPVSW